MTDSTPIVLASDWVMPESVQARASYLSGLIGYPFDDADWIAIEFGLERSDNERGLWFTYPLMGEPPIELALAAEPEAAPVMVRIQSAEKVETRLMIQIETTLSIFNSFDLR